VVSKVWPSHATPSGIRQACAASLARLGTDYLDLYLLHWHEGVSDSARWSTPLKACARKPHPALGRVEFPGRDMEDLFRVPAATPAPQPGTLQPGGSQRRTRRAPLVRAAFPADHGVFAAGQNRRPSPQSGADPRRRETPSEPAAIALAWTIRSGRVIAIPESGSAAHVRENAAALSLGLTVEDLADLDRAFPV